MDLEIHQYPAGKEPLKPSIVVGISRDDAEEREDPIPSTTAELLDWLDERYPEECPRYSDPVTVDNCLRRSGIRELIKFMRYKLEVQAHENLEEIG